MASAANLRDNVDFLHFTLISTSAAQTNTPEEEAPVKRMETSIFCQGDMKTWDSTRS